MSSSETGLTSTDEQALVRVLAQQVLEAAAPEELALFDETAEEYFADPQGVLGAKSRDEAVGFGVDMALLTPYLLAVVTPVIQLLASMVGEAVRKEGQGSVTALVRRLLGHRDPGTPVPADVQPSPLTHDQLAQVREVAAKRGRAVGLSKAQADLLADAIAGGISVSPTG